MKLSKWKVWNKLLTILSIGVTVTSSVIEINLVCCTFLVRSLSVGLAFGLVSYLGFNWLAYLFCFSGTKSVLGSYGRTTCSPRCSTFKAWGNLVDYNITQMHWKCSKSVNIMYKDNVQTCSGIFLNHVCTCMSYLPVFLIGLMLDWDMYLAPKTKPPEWKGFHLKPDHL